MDINSGNTAVVNPLDMLRKFERTYMVAGLTEEAADMATVIADVSELVAELRNAHEIIKLGLHHVPPEARSPWFLAIDDAGLCGDGVTRFHERQVLLDRVRDAS